MKKEVLNKIKELELELLDPKVRKSKKRLGELLVDDFLEFGASGLIVDKKKVLSNLPKQNNIVWQTSNLKVKNISENIFLLTYKVKKTNIKTGEIINSLRSSIWKIENGKAKMFFHQGTLLK